MEYSGKFEIAVPLWKYSYNTPKYVLIFDETEFFIP
jgi:hypothetical protein